jgi:hypothetical protein
MNDTIENLEVPRKYNMSLNNSRHIIIYGQRRNVSPKIIFTQINASTLSMPPKEHIYPFG